MANPTLLGTETPWLGWTLAAIAERLLATRGLSEASSTTGRTPATTQDSSDARERLRRAIGFLAERFPSIWSIREYSTTWPVGGEHSIVLPSNAEDVMYVTFDGLALAPIDEDDWLRILKPDQEGGGVQSGTDVLYYRMVGISDSDSAGAHDYRPVLRLFATPGTDAKALVVGFLAKAPALASGEEAKYLPLRRHFQEWVLERAREIWGTDEGDPGLSRAAMVARMGPRLDGLGGVEGEIRRLLQGTRENTKRAKWRFPRIPGFRRDE